MLITLLIVVLILGIVFWVIQQLPLAQPFKLAALVIVAVIAVVYLLSLLPGHHGLVV